MPKKTEILPNFTSWEAKIYGKHKGVVVGERKAGWYPDGPGRERYFDGTKWTEHTSGSTPSEENLTESESNESVEVFVKPVDSTSQESNQTNTTDPIGKLVC